MKADGYPRAMSHRQRSQTPSRVTRTKHDDLRSVCRDRLGDLLS